MPALPAPLSKPKKRRSKAQPRFGWSGGSIIRPPRDRAGQVHRIVADMPARTASVNELVDELLQLGGRYHRYLHQDECGPTRAQRLAALRQMIGRIDALSAALVRLPRSLRCKLSDYLAAEGAAAPAAAGGLYWHDVATAGRIALAADSLRSDLAVKQRPSQGELIERLATEAGRTAGLLASLDTTTEGDVVVTGTALVGRRLRKNRPTAALGLARAGLARLRQRAMATLAYLEKKKGAAPAPSLRWLVGELCALWRRETGSRVTGDSVGYRQYSMSKAGNFHKGRITAAGQFILDLVEAFQPAKPRSDADPQHVRSQILLTDKRDGRVRRIHQAIRDYIAARSKETKRGRPPKMRSVQ